MECPKCGAMNPDGAEYCNLCAKRLIEQPRSELDSRLEETEAQTAAHEVGGADKIWRGGIAGIAGGLVFLFSLGLMQAVGVTVLDFLFADLGVNAVNLSFFIFIIGLFCLISGGVGGNLEESATWPGTLDPSPWFCIADSIRFLSGLMPGGLEALMRRNHELAVWAQRMLCERLGVQPVGVESMLGSMAAVHLPDNAAAFDSQGNPVPGEEYRLNNELFANFRIEVPAFFWPAAPKMLLRVCAQAYNHSEQYEQLAEALKKTVVGLG